MARTIAALVCTAILVSVQPAPAVYAAENIACQEGSGVSRWRGEALQQSSQKHGVSGTAHGYTLLQCINPPIFAVTGSFYFSNIVPSSGGYNDVIQVGMGVCRSPIGNCKTGMRYYSAWGRTSTTPGCDGFMDRAPLAGDEGAYVVAPHDFKVWHANDVWWFFVDAANVGGVAEANICWTGKQAVWFSETLDLGDQLGGTPANRFRVWSTNYANTENGQFFWTNFNPDQACNYGGAGAPYFCDIAGARKYDTWTDR